MRKAGAPHLSRVAFPVRTLIITVVVIGAVVAAFFIGTLTAPKNSVATVSDERIQATAVVEQRAIVPDTVILGTVGEGKTKNIVPSVLPETATVTKQALKKGDDVVAGQLLGSVAGTPVFAMQGKLPLYRDLAAGDRGDDVVAFQESLQNSGYTVQITGVVDSATIQAVTGMFQRAGYALPQREIEPPPESTPAEPGSDGASGEGSSEEGETNAAPAPRTQPYIPVSAFAAIDGKGGTVLSVAAVASTVGPEQPLAKVRVGRRSISAHVNAVEAEQLSKGTEVHITADADTFAGTVENVGEFQAGSEGRTPGHNVTFTTKDEAFDKVQNGTQVRVGLKTKVKPQKAVPVTALRHDADGDYVLVQSTGSGSEPKHDNGQGADKQGSDKQGADKQGSDSRGADKQGAGSTSEPRRVKVTVGKTAAGWAAVESDDLAVGDTVVL
ncbi:hypothetical protein [Arthrobacter sp. HMSC06H05]|uniref:hypothetical protein n=1 Tax=Arthrobacter sp. HMSC06H05 TaxID=1581128 RepID=UPI000B17E5B2|nr:hypothetical protein [Arthrobacter sp. HMSC06H05]